MRFCHDSGPTPVFVASCRSGWRYPGHPRSETARPTSSRALLPEVAKRAVHRSTVAGDRQAQKLLRRPSYHHGIGRARHEAVREQPRRGLPRASSAEEVPNAPFQVAGSGSAIPGGTRSGRKSLSARSTSDPGNPLSDVSCSGVCPVAGADVRSSRVLAPAKVLILPRQDQVDSTLE